MTESIFAKIYSYRERENKNSKENFLIEIFAYCLQTDTVFLKSFLSLIDLMPDNETTIKTQVVYDYGRPDIEINIPSKKTCILIECKIDNTERPNQLEDYKQILIEKNIKNRHLVYLTKHYDLRVNNDKRIKLYPIKWLDVFQLINHDNLQISKELKIFIKDENMDQTKNFTYTDLIVLKNITGTISKMDEVLDLIKEYYEKRIGILSKDSARSTRMKDEWYINYQEVGGAKYKFSIDIGFIWWWENDEIYLGARIYLPKSSKYKNTETFYKLFKKVLKDWEFTEYDNYYDIGNYKQVSEFITDEDEQVPAMVKYLKSCIDKLEEVKKLDSKIYK